MTVDRFRVAEMDCLAEEQLVRMKLHDLDDIDAVSVDLVTRIVTVSHGNESDLVESALLSLDLGASRSDDATPIEPDSRPDSGAERRALLIALGINAGFLVTELVAGIIARSMGLIADSFDMAADAAVYMLSLVAVHRSAPGRKRLAATSGYLQLAVATAGVVEVLRRFVVGGDPPDVTTMIVVSLLALAGNVATLLVLQRVRTGEVHIQASWIFTANDIKVNSLVIAAAIAVSVGNNSAPDLIAGGLIFLIVANGSRRILQLSR